jgi:hypothetical protein
MPAFSQRTAKLSRHGRLRRFLLGLLPILSTLGGPLMVWKGLSALTASSVP